MFSTSSVNVMNPAAFGLTPRQSFLFNFGIEGGHFRNSQTKYQQSGASDIHTAYNSINIHDIAFQMPLAKGVGLGFSLTPYSNVGYTMHRNDMDIAGAMGNARYEYMGEGDVSEVKLGVGWAPSKKFSVGASLIYYWGSINRSYKMIPKPIVGVGEYSTTTGLDTYDVSRFNAQFGLMWSPILKSDKILSFGATYNIGGSLNPDMMKYVYVDNLLSSVVRKDSDSALPLRLPKQVVAGVYYQNLKVRFGADYVYQRWGGDNDSLIENENTGVQVRYTDTHTIKVGVQYIPRHTDVRNYLRRMAYRVGARYGDYYQTYGGEKIKQLAFTAGFGLPVKLFGSSSVDVGVEWGLRGLGNQTIMVDNKKVGLVKQQFVKFSVGLSLFGEDDWFVQRKYQ